MDQGIIANALTLIYGCHPYIVTNNKNLRIQQVRDCSLSSLSTVIFCKVITLHTTPVRDQIRLISRIPNAYVASKILEALETLMLTKTCSYFGLYWVLVQYICDKEDIPNGPRLTCTLINSHDSISSLITLSKGLHKIGRRPFGIRLYIHGYMNDIGRLTHLINLNELWYHEKDRNSLENTINNWLSYLTFEKKSWTNLKHLNLPYLNNVVFLFKILYYVPSLETIFVAVKPDILQAIPILKDCLVVQPLNGRQANERHTSNNYIIPVEIYNETFLDKERQLDHLEGTLYCVVKPLSSNENAKQIALNGTNNAPTARPKPKINRSKINRRFLEKYR